MKFLICGDLHITSEKPVNRIDDYPITQYNKIKWIFDTAYKNDAAILFPGDIFDHYKQSNYILQKYINLFSSWNSEIYAVFGQHDLKYHSLDRDDTALKVLEAAGTLEILGRKNYLYGASFGEEIPSIELEEEFNILLTHRMIVHSDKIWGTQKEFDYAENLLWKNNFDLIVSGDNHHYFHAEVDGKHLFNCGSLMRATTAQLNHIPKVVLFDTNNPNKYKEIPIPVKPISEVFDLSTITEKKQKEERYNAFIEGLSNTKEITLSFTDNLDAYLKKNKVEKEIEDMITNEVINE